jgi:DNA polymerase-3 subunit delta
MDKDYDYKRILKDIEKDDIPSIVLLFGKEQFHVEWAASALIDKYVNPLTRELDLTIFNEKPTLEDLINACETLTMFSKRRLVVVSKSGFFKGKKKEGSKDLSEETSEDDNESDDDENFRNSGGDLDLLCKYLGDIPPSTLLIFKEEEVNKVLRPYKAVKKLGKDYDFVSLDREEIKRFIRNRIKKQGHEIRDEIVDLIHDLSGYDHKNSDYTLYNLENDLKKIMAHCQGLEITALDVTSTLEGDLDTFVFSLVEAMGSGKKGEALNLFYNIISGGGKFFGILGLLIGQYELMLDVKELLDKGRTLPTIEGLLKVNSYRLKKALPTIQKYSSGDLRGLLQKLFAMERNIKSGLIEQNLALEIFIGEL